MPDPDSLIASDRKFDVHIDQDIGVKEYRVAGPSAGDEGYPEPEA